MSECCLYTAAVCLKTAILLINVVYLFLFIASQLDDLILHVHNNTDCPCSKQICERARGGYRIGVALIKRMWLDPDLHYRASSPVE